MALERNLQRVHVAIKLAEDSEKPLRQFKGERMPYVRAFWKKRVVKTEYAPSPFHHSLIHKACCRGFEEQIIPIELIEIRREFILAEESFVKKFDEAAENPTVFTNLKYVYRVPPHFEPELCVTKIQW